MLETIRVNELTVACERPANATRAPVLFVHGYFATAVLWTPWLSFFAERGVPAYAVNLRGRGGSKPTIELGRASISDFIDDASEVARYIGATAVVGHSMGGLIAQGVAERGDVRAAVLVSPAPPKGITVMSPRLAIKQLKYLPAILASRPVTPNREDLRDIVLNRVPPDMQDAILDQMVPDSGRAGREMSITGVAIDASRVRCPLLVVVADEDRFIPSPIGERIARRYGAAVHPLTHHGHMNVLEPGWEQLADRVATWIAEQVS